MRSMNREVPDILTVVKCRADRYSESAVIRSKTEWTASAVCESCFTRVYLTAGKLSDHWLTVTIHEVRGRIHEVDEKEESK